MISQLSIKALKSFKDKSFPLKNLTLLSGLNNSGKSTVIQALRMYAAAHKNQSPLLEGHGDVSEMRANSCPSSDPINITMTLADGTRSSLILTDTTVSRPQGCPVLLYVSADRLGPQTSLPLNPKLHARPSVGDCGEFVIGFIQKLSNAGYLVPDSLVHENSQGKTFEYALEGWLTEIAPGVSFKFHMHTKADISHAEIDNYRPTNVGFGLSYTLPIIAAALGAAVLQPSQGISDESLKSWEDAKSQNGILLILENPEAHLHPRGQTAMGKLIALVAASGVQVIVETHSDHLMDGIRIAVKNRQIEAEDVLFHYLSKVNGETTIDTPTLDENGKLDVWPEGFFDQTLKNRAILAKRTS